MPAVQRVDESLEDLAAKHCRDGGDREQELVVGDADPLTAVEAQPPNGHDGVQVGVEEQSSNLIGTFGNFTLATTSGRSN